MNPTDPRAAELEAAFEAWHRAAWPYMDFPDQAIAKTAFLAGAAASEEANRRRPKGSITEGLKRR